MAILTGQFDRTLDDKCRFLIPKSFREIFSGTEVYLSPGTQHSIELHTTQSLEAKAQRISDSSSRHDAKHRFARLFYSQSHVVPVDLQGRIRIPASLVSWAGLERSITLIGTGSHLEIWCSQQWSGFVRKHETEFDELCELASGLSAQMESGESVGSSGPLDHSMKTRPK